jgi:hypothetical protein
MSVHIYRRNLLSVQHVGTHIQTQFALCSTYQYTYTDATCSVFNMSVHTYRRSLPACSVFNMSVHIYRRNLLCVQHVSTHIQMQFAVFNMSVHIYRRNLLCVQHVSTHIQVQFALCSTCQYTYTDAICSVFNMSVHIYRCNLLCVQNVSTRTQSHLALCSASGLPDACFIPRQIGRLTVGHNVTLALTMSVNPVWRRSRIPPP